MRPVFELIAVYQSYFVLVVLLLVLTRAGIYNYKYDSFLILKWFTQDRASNWLMRRYLKLLLFTIYALSTFIVSLLISHFDFLGHIQYAQPFMFIVLGIIWLTCTLFTTFIAFFEILIIRKARIEEVIRLESGA